MGSISRRGFFGLAAGGLLAACGNGSGGRGSSGSSGDAAALVSYFPSGIYVAGRPQRMPFGVADAEGVPMVDGPGTLDATLKTQDGKELAKLSAARRADGLPRAYYPFDIEVADPGIYALSVQLGGSEQQALFELVAAGTLKLPGPGDPMPGFDTPTVADHRGVEPICTRPEQCPFHAQTLSEALAAKQPIAYLIGTPAHCQTGICGPVLDLLVDESKKTSGVTFIHAEVYADDAATVPAPVITSLDLQYEPLLFLIGADGIVRHRLDVIYDTGELHEKLADVTA